MPPPATPTLPRCRRRRAQAEKTIRLVFARSVKAADVAGAFSERLIPKLGKESADLKTFQSYFAGANFASGVVVTFSAHQGKLTTTIGGKQMGTLDSKPLAKALFEIYLGADPVAPSAKADFGKGVAAAAAALA